MRIRWIREASLIAAGGARLTPVKQIRRRPYPSVPIGERHRDAHNSDDIAVPDGGAYRATRRQPADDPLRQDERQ
ncbi:hypothetical protein WJ22_27465 [Burkholderia vietnamiensis]|nr:hypothetical protein MYA_5695 [Burkholderia sp. KJ006]KVF82075.1 hypothetical protein WJ19_26875 [Burkholderia vietnamiensis]KVF87178.1 hypothetical protein WJ20_22025 [Burkholderia vietnamiensis]KVF96093.1 hypothetical protein WJ22_27465 [Burkholderia vietnamiensis]KVS07251.1 hypothetical protein WK29_22985 [Burkholderia vietnamiensis]